MTPTELITYWRNAAESARGIAEYTKGHMGKRDLLKLAAIYTATADAIEAGLTSQERNTET